MKTLIKKVSTLITAAAIALTTFATSSLLSASAASVTEDLYVIQSSLNSSKVLDITDRGTSNGANCQLYDRNNSAAQAFRITSAGNGYYTIQLAMTSDKVLDVSGGKGYSGCNVQLYSFNGTSAQLWSFESAGSGSYYIKSKTGYYLDVSGASTANGTNIQIYKGNKTNAQKFKLVKNYSVEKSVNYAQKYTDTSGGYKGTYNSTYNIYHNYQLNQYRGYDCANYVSQCLYSGGLVSTYQWAPVYRGESYKGNTAKTTWVSATDLYYYLSSLGYPVQKVKSDLSNIRKGDIVFTGEGNHATICTGTKNGKPIYCAHSKWRKDAEYSYEDFKNGYVVDMSFASCGKVKYTCSNTTNNGTYYGKYTGSSTSIVTALNSMKIDSSKAFRAKLAVANGIVSKTSQYTGTASQNSALLKLLKAGKLKKVSVADTVEVVKTKTYTVKSSSGAKVRTGAGTSYGQKGGLAKGSVVTYDQTKTANGYTWYRIVSVKTTSGSWGSFKGYWVAGV